MKRKDFIKRYNIGDNHEEWFLSNKGFINDLQVLGWKLQKPKYLCDYHRDFNKVDVICTNPNFYTDGDIIGNSRKTIIMASGIFRFKYNEKEYTNLHIFLKEEGLEVLSHLEKIEWIEVMDWIIVGKKDGRLKGQFDDWDDCPTRKDVDKNDNSK